MAEQAISFDFHLLPCSSFFSPRFPLSVCCVDRYVCSVRASGCESSHPPVPSTSIWQISPRCPLLNSALHHCRSIILSQPAPTPATEVPPPLLRRWRSVVRSPRSLRWRICGCCWMEMAAVDFEFASPALPASPFGFDGGSDARFLLHDICWT